MATTPSGIRIGTVDLPDRMERERYFKELDYLEVSGLFSGPMKPSALERWAQTTPRDAVGLVAPFVLTHRHPPKAPKLWAHDATSGDFRDSAHGRSALGELNAAVTALGALHVVFTSPPLFAASAANRDQLRWFFGELATAEAVGASRVWVPDGLWDLRTAIKFAGELGVLCAFDPLVRDPSEPPEIHYDLEVEALYLRITGPGRTGALKNERQEDLAMLLEHYEGLPITVAFESAARWHDARNLKKTLEATSS